MPPWAMLLRRATTASSGGSFFAPEESGIPNTGEAGTVYLCHPLLVHAAQMHRGSTPRFMAQPPLHPAEPFRLDRSDGSYSPVEIAIRSALQESDGS